MNYLFVLVVFSFEKETLLVHNLYLLEMPVLLLKGKHNIIRMGPISSWADLTCYLFVFVERIQKPDIQADSNEQRMSSELFNEDCSACLNLFF